MLHIPDSVTVGVVGGGGSEAAIVDALLKDTRLKKVICIPGRDGYRRDHRVDCWSDVPADNVKKIMDETADTHFDLIVARQEVFLANGGADAFLARGIPVVGCTQDLARLESDKVYAKRFFKDHGIPTADFAIANSADEAREIVDDWMLKRWREKVVQKAKGLAEGKGVIIASSHKEAYAAIQNLMVDGPLKKAYPKAAEQLVIEEFLPGREASVTVFSDGISFVDCPVFVDHKHRNEGDKGQMTGGMGVYGPDPLFTEELRQKVMTRIVKPIIAATGYKGVLYVGLMIVNDEPYVLETNVRPGDPETQGFLPLLDSSFLELCWGTATSQLSEVKPVWNRTEAVVALALVSGPYPGALADTDKGYAISGLKEAEKLGIQVLHAGTKLARGSDGVYLNWGGRVLYVVAKKPTFTEAMRLTHAAAELIKWKDREYRADIGLKAIWALGHGM